MRCAAGRIRPFRSSKPVRRRNPAVGGFDSHAAPLSHPHGLSTNVDRNRRARFCPNFCPQGLGRRDSGGRGEPFTRRALSARAVDVELADGERVAAVDPLVAARAAGHPAIGIDLERRYCQIAAERIAGAG